MRQVKSIGGRGDCCQEVSSTSRPQGTREGGEEEEEEEEEGRHQEVEGSQCKVHVLEKWLQQGKLRPWGEGEAETQGWQEEGEWLQEEGEWLQEEGEWLQGEGCWLEE